MFAFEYKGKKYTEEEISKQIESAITIECDHNKRLLLMNLKNTKLRVLSSLSSDIQEICDCFFLKKYMAALTLTNLLFETMVKLTLVYHEANGRTLDDGYEFENIYEDELKKYGKKNLGENIEALYKNRIITANGRDRLLDLKDLFRNPYSHGSNNQYINSATTTIYKGQLGSNDIKLKRSSCWPGGTEGQYEDRVVRQEDISMGINPALDYLSMPSSVEIKAGAATAN